MFPFLPSPVSRHSDDEHEGTCRAASRRSKSRSMVGHGNAGLASNFIDLAHAKVKNPGGVLVLVLPATFLQGPSWAAARRLLDEHYRDVVIVTIADDRNATDRAFSADTGMAEVLVVATRKRAALSRRPGPALFVNLLRNVRSSILEAVMVARGSSANSRGSYCQPDCNRQRNESRLQYPEHAVRHRLRGPARRRRGAGRVRANVRGELLLPTAA